MALIDIGPGAIDRTSTFASNQNLTRLYGDNPSNATGVLDSFEIWAYTSFEGLKVGTFYNTTASNYTNRDYESIGNVTSGSKQTFTGKNCTVYTNDLLGVVYTAGACEEDGAGGTNIYQKSGDYFGAGSQSYTPYAGYQGSFYATGTTAEEVTTQTPTNIVWCGALGNGNIINIGGSALTAKGFCYKVGTSGDPTISDSKVSTTGSSTGAYTVTIGPLEASTSYRVRAYATNDEGTFYGDTVQIATPAQGTQGGGAGGGIFSF
jgi:hypothetical protein